MEDAIENQASANESESVCVPSTCSAMPVAQPGPLGEVDEIGIILKRQVYIGNNKDLTLSYLESDHLLILHKDVVLESFSLINSDTWLKGVARSDSLMILNKLKDGNNRRFRIQFDGDDNEIDGLENRKQCTDLLKRYFPISDYDDAGASNKGEIANIDRMVINKLQLRKAYAVEVPKENLKEMIMLCLTDSTFPSYIDEVDNIIKNIGK